MRVLAIAAIAFFGYHFFGWYAIFPVITTAISFALVDNIPKDVCKYCGATLKLFGTSKATCSQCGKDQ